MWGELFWREGPNDFTFDIDLSPAEIIISGKVNRNVFEYCCEQRQGLLIERFLCCFVQLLLPIVGCGYGWDPTSSIFDYIKDKGKIIFRIIRIVSMRKTLHVHVEVPHYPRSQ